jgi:hypothetical protein
MGAELTVEHGLIFRGEHVVIPTGLQQLMKQKIHSSHMGTELCLCRARECIFWLGMSAEIRQLVEACETCQKFSGSQTKETLKSHEIPSRPWEKIATDLFTMKICNTEITPVDVVRGLGVWLDSRLRMDTHVTNICSAAFYHLYNIRRIRKFLSKSHTETLIHAFVTCRLDYCRLIASCMDFLIPSFQSFNVYRMHVFV